MKNNRQLLITLFLLITISMPPLLFVYYQANQAFVRFEMEEELEKSKLQTIRIPVNEVSWYKKNRELLVDGKLFDVKTQTELQGVIEFTGLFDEQETAIALQLDALRHQHADGGDDAGSISAKYASIFLYKEHHHQSRFQPFLIRLTHNIRFRNHRWISPALPILTPPPRYC